VSHSSPPNVAIQTDTRDPYAAEIGLKVKVAFGSGGGMRQVSLVPAGFSCNHSLG
jgi:hypothetical protein